MWFYQELNRCSVNHQRRPVPRQLKVHGHISAVFEALYRMSQNMQCCGPLGGVGGVCWGGGQFFLWTFGWGRDMDWMGVIFFFTPCYFEVDQIKICCPCMLQPKLPIQLTQSNFFEYSDELVRTYAVLIMEAIQQKNVASTNLSLLIQIAIIIYIFLLYIKLHQHYKSWISTQF